MSRTIAQLSSADLGAAVELTELRELYRREALQRKLLYNQVYPVSSLQKLSAIVPVHSPMRTAVA